MNALEQHAGKNDALKAFGIAHGTPSPPPAWAHGWLTDTRKLTIPSMLEKRAFDPLTLGALGLGAKAALPWAAKAIGWGGVSHLGGNILQKLQRRYAPQLAQRQMASGIAHGLENRKIHPVVERLVSRGLGSEYLLPYEAGQLLAKQTASMDPRMREAALRSPLSLIKEAPHLSKAPIIGALPGATEMAAKKPGFWHRMLPTSSTTTEFKDLPAWQRIIPTAIGLPAAIVEPGIAGHIAINKIRDAVAKSTQGRAWMAKELAEGARGKVLPSWKKNLREFGLSPATSDPRNIGLAANKDYGLLQKKLNDVAVAHGYGAIPTPGAAAITNFAEGVRHQLKRPPQAALPSTTQGSGGLTKAMLLGGGLYALHNAMRDDDRPQRSY